jgi:hypothetical protein
VRASAAGSAAAAAAARAASRRGASAAAAAAAPPPPRAALDWASQHRAATIAAWSGFCYLLDDSEVGARLAAQGLSLVACGRNEFTSWFVADGAIDAARFARRALERRPPGGGGGGGGDAAAAAAAAAAAVGAPPPRRERFVMLRGVQWAAPDLDTARMWRSLMRVWPRPLMAAGPGAEIVAHDGVADMAAVRGAARRGAWRGLAGLARGPAAGGCGRCKWRAAG